MTAETNKPEQRERNEMADGQPLMNKKQGWQYRRAFLLMAPIATLLAILLNGMGILQSSEWAIFDYFFHLRPLEAPDSRVVVVTIDDADLTQVGTWPIPDAVLAETIQILKAQQPRVIALDLYRDLPVEPGHADLLEVYRTTPMLIGAQKQFGSQRVPPPAELADRHQVAFIDLVKDADQRIRRALVAAADEQGQTFLSLGATAALHYLAADRIQLEAVADAPDARQLGKAIFRAIHPHSGGYHQVDSSGYQILLNYRGGAAQFQTIPITQILQGALPDNLVRDRMVFIGSTAASINDVFSTPYDRFQPYPKRMAGVFLHANLASQMTSAAIDGRPNLHSVPEGWEWLWTLGWVYGSVAVRKGLSRWMPLSLAFLNAFLSGVTVCGGLLLVSYALFEQGWWLPTAMPIAGVTIATVIQMTREEQRSQHYLQRLAYTDGLTQVANRRYFDQELLRAIQTRGYLSVLLCDVDYFKLYNDTYGHQAGDLCLQQVAAALQKAARSADLVARYGGEEFALILPHTPSLEAAQLATRLIHQVRTLNLPHAQSSIADRVTLSCGVTTIQIRQELGLTESMQVFNQVLASADQALYQAKAAGRDRFIQVTDSLSVSDLT